MGTNQLKVLISSLFVAQESINILGNHIHRRKPKVILISRFIRQWKKYDYIKTFQDILIMKNRETWDGNTS